MCVCVLRVVVAVDVVVFVGVIVGGVGVIGGGVVIVSVDGRCDLCVGSFCCWALFVEWL